MVILAPVHVELRRALVELALGRPAKARIDMGCAQVDVREECIHITVPFPSFFPTQVVTLFQLSPQNLLQPLYKIDSLKAVYPLYEPMYIINFLPWCKE